MSCQKPYRIWLLNCSSSPWLSIINVIRYSLNKKKFHILPGRMPDPFEPGSLSNQPHSAGAIRAVYTLLLNSGSGKKETPFYAVLLGHAVKRDCNEKLVRKTKKNVASPLQLETHHTFYQRSYCRPIAPG